MTEYYVGLPVTNDRINGLMADFSGMKNLEKVVGDVLTKIELNAKTQTRISSVKGGTMTKQDFDGWFSEVVRMELGKVLGIIRNRAVEKADKAGAGSAASAVKRRMYKDEFAGNVNIAAGHRRISSRKRIVPEPQGGASGVRRPRTVKDRTKKIREYYGPDRDFILRILEGGRDVFMATPDGPIGRRSMATYGRRGAIGARNWFFHQMQSDMEQAAQQLGETLIGTVEQWVETQFENINE